MDCTAAQSAVRRGIDASSYWTPRFTRDVDPDKPYRSAYRFSDGETIGFTRGDFDGYCAAMRRVDADGAEHEWWWGDADWMGVFLDMSARYGCEIIISQCWFLFLNARGKTDVDLNFLRANMPRLLSWYRPDDRLLMEKALVMFYFGMVAENCKENAFLKARIKICGLVCLFHRTDSILSAMDIRRVSETFQGLDVTACFFKAAAEFYTDWKWRDILRHADPEGTFAGRWDDPCLPGAVYPWGPFGVMSA